MADALRLKDVRAGYGETVVIEDIGLSLPERGSLAVLGRNGVGKTTLLATIMGHTTFHDGSIEYRGARIEKLPVYERNRLGVGLVPQTRDIFPSLSVEENLTVAARPGRWTLERVHDLFPRLADRRKHWGNQISGGEQQMLAIGRALMARPRLLLMDEPSMGLAPALVDQVFDILQTINSQGTTILVVEQNAAVALSIAHRGYVLQNGSIVLHDQAAALLKTDSIRRAYLGED